MGSRYARLESERRFQLATAPEGLDAPRLIEDRYIRGTRLRVRTVTSPERTRVHKLGQKVPFATSSAWHTTMYLDEAEFVVLAALPADSLMKWRYTSAIAPGWAVDIFDGVLSGLVTAEIEVDESGKPSGCPWPGVEVTDDPRFAGGHLAALDPWQAASLIRGE